MTVHSIKLSPLGDGFAHDENVALGNSFTHDKNRYLDESSALDKIVALDDSFALDKNRFPDEIFAPDKIVALDDTSHLIKSLHSTEWLWWHLDSVYKQGEARKCSKQLENGKLLFLLK